MNKRKRMVSVLAGIMAAVMLLTLMLSLLPTPASAASSSEIRKQINALKEEKEAIKDKIEEVQGQYEENENEIVDLMERKSVIDQEVQLLNEQVDNINDQLKAFNLLIADKQDELDNAEERYQQLNDDNKLRIRTMEEEGELSYWEVLFKANNFSDLLDRLNMVEEIAASDNRRLQELADAANNVVEAQQELEVEKEDMEKTKEELVQKAVNSALEKAGINPAHVDSEDHIASNTAKGWLTPEQADKAREIIKTVSAEKAANLPEAMINNIANGRLNKFFKENTLEEQEYQMGDGKTSVKAAIAAVDKEAKVTVFKRFSLND